MASSKFDSKIYITIEASSRDKLINKNFNYPIFFVFHLCSSDPKRVTDNLVYERKIYVQSKEVLEEGIQCRLFQLERKRDCYRLSAIATDNNKVKYKSIGCNLFRPCSSGHPVK
jgi:hypothetical protein